MLVLVDNGHGVNTLGKCSPDGKFREYKWNREIAHEVVAELKKRGYCAELLVTEDIDISLAERVKRANNKCNQLGTKNVLLLSVHVNAAGNGQWLNAKGWSCFTSKGLTKSDKIADELYKVAEKLMPNRTMRKEYSDGDADWEAGFYILKNTKCPAVLTENFFMDNRDDLAYLTSAEGRKAIIATHVEGVINYIKKHGKG
jgi:N-acetylmuramoyl-L-alanine amidase